MILFPGPGLVPAVTLASGPSSRGLRTCLTTSLSLSLCVMGRAEPAASLPALANLLKCHMLLPVVPLTADHLTPLGAGVSSGTLVILDQ